MSSTLTPGAPAPPFPAVWNSEKKLYIADPSVDLSNLSAKLNVALQQLASIHLLMFGLQMIVTHGADGQHVTRSKHYTGQAVDVRVRDKSPTQQLAFANVLQYFVAPFGIAVYDERARDGQSHFHIEEAN
jgi:hypothetical protein